MNISINLKYTQMMSLVMALEMLMTEDVAPTRERAIILFLMLKFYKKLKQKCAVLEMRNHTISVEPETALAFIIFFRFTKYNAISHAGAIINDMIFQFDKQTTSYHHA